MRNCLVVCLLVPLVAALPQHLDKGSTDEKVQELQNVGTEAQKSARYFTGFGGNGAYPGGVIFTVGGGYYPNGGVYPQGGFPGVYPVFGGQYPPVYPNPNPNPNPNNPYPSGGDGGNEIPVGEDGGRIPGGVPVDEEVEVINVPGSNGGGYPGGYPGFYPGNQAG